jgi:hypothetical protein
MQKRDFVYSPDQTAGSAGMRFEARLAGASHATADSGAVRMGSQAPSFPLARSPKSSIADTGKVRLGSQAPSLPPRK